MFKKVVVTVLTILIIQVTQAQAKQRTQADQRTFQSLAQESIVGEMGKSYWYGLLVGGTTGLAGSVLSAVMIQNWELNAPQTGLMFGMPIGMVFGSARGVVGWDDSVDENALWASRIGAATPVLIGGLLGSLMVKNQVKGMRNGAFTGQFLAPLGAMLGYRLYQTAFPEQTDQAAEAAPIAPVRQPVMPRHVSLSDGEPPQEDFVLQVIAIRF